MRAIKVLISAIVWGICGLIAAVAFTLLYIYASPSSPRAPDFPKEETPLALLVLGPFGFAVGAAHGIVRLSKRGEEQDETPPKASMFKLSVTKKDALVAIVAALLAALFWIAGGAGVFVSVFCIGVAIGALVTTRPVRFGLMMAGSFIAVAAILSVEVAIVQAMKK